MPGIMTSSVIASGRSRRAIRRPSSPLSAPSTLEAVSAERPAQQFMNRGIVIDHQHSRRAAGCSPGRSRCRPQLARFILAADDVGRKAQRERRALAQLALHRDVAAHHLAEAPGDGQAQAGAAELARGGSVRLREGLEQRLASAPASCRCRCPAHAKSIHSEPSSCTRLTVSVTVPFCVNLQALRKQIQQALPDLGRRPRASTRYPAGTSSAA